MSYDIHHPDAILKIMLYACRSADEPFCSYSKVHPDWYDTIEPHAASAVIQKLYIKETPSKWLANNQLQQFDATPLYPIERLGTYFMSGSKSLTTVDFSGSTFESVVVIEDNFLYKCSNLEHVDLSSLKKVIGIGRGFCSNSSLKKIDLSFAKNVDEVLAEFLCATQLKEIDVSPLHQLEYLPYNFLSNNPLLAEIRGLETFTKIEVVETGFLVNCCLLKKIDVSFMKNVTTIPRSFLHNCSGLEVIENLNLLTQVTMIEDRFLSGCTNLKQVDFSGLGKSLQSLETFGFLEDCLALEEIDLTPLEEAIKNIEDPDTVALRSIVRLRKRDTNKFIQGNKDLPAVALGKLKKIIVPKSIEGKVTCAILNFSKGNSVPFSVEDDEKEDEKPKKEEKEKKEKKEDEGVFSKVKRMLW